MRHDQRTRATHAARTAAAVVVAFVAGAACGDDARSLATPPPTAIEVNGGSLAAQLAKAGNPPITAAFGVAEHVPADDTRHFALTIATENGDNPNDAAALYALMDGH